MTEAAVPKIPANHEIVQVRHYEAGPPAGLELVEPGDTFATTKEEEWVSKKKTELTTTRQIETRVKRQVVLEDGKVVEDSGPIVTTNTSEDTEKQEHSQTELRKLGGDEVDNAAAIEPGESPSNKLATVGKDWVPAPNPDGVVREVKERKVISREETEEVKETEDVQHLGDITDEDFLAAVHSGSPDLRQVLRERTEGNNTVVSTGPRVVLETTKKRKVTDTEDTSAVSSVRPDGKIVTETTRTTEHEEVKDEDLPDDAPDVNNFVQNSQRYRKTKDQEFVEYLADGIKIGEEMRYKAEKMEGERHGDGIDEDWDSLSTRIRRNRRQLGKYNNQKSRGIEDQVASPLDRKDALTKKPLDFDEEEETRKAETTKWLENHFGSESTRSSQNSLIDDDKPMHSKGFFNVTFKSQPTRLQPLSKPTIVQTVNTQTVVPASPQPDRATPVRNGYFQGISEWSERKYEGYKTSHYNGNGYGSTLQRQNNYREDSPPIPPERKRALERRQRSSQDSNRYDSGYRTHSRNEMSRDSHEELQDEPPPDYSPPPPSPPPTSLHKKSYQRTRFAAEPQPQPSKGKSGNIIGQSIRKLVGKIRSASAERKAKQRAKRSPSPQSTYQQYNRIDNIPSSRSRSREPESVVMDRQPRRGHSPVQRYYLGEDPFGGSIYGRENKYDGVQPARSSSRFKGQRRSSNPSEDENRMNNTLGRFSKSTGRLVNDYVDYSRSSQTLPRNIRSDSSRHQSSSRLAKNNQSDNTINVSIINRPLTNEGPAKPARTYKSHLSRSKSFNLDGGVQHNMYKNNHQMHRLEENPIGLKSPGIVSKLSRSTKDLAEVVEENHANNYTSRFSKNDFDVRDGTKGYMKGPKDRGSDLYRTLQNEDKKHMSRKLWQSPNAYSTPIKSTRIANYNHGDTFEPPTRLNASDSYSPPVNSLIRRGSNGTDDYSETFHTTTRNDDPNQPSVTDTIQKFSKKTIPAKDGRTVQTIESTERKSVTRSRFRGEPLSNVNYLENGKFNHSSNGGVTFEVRNYRK